MNKLSNSLGQREETKIYVVLGRGEFFQCHLSRTFGGSAIEIYERKRIEEQQSNIACVVATEISTIFARCGNQLAPLHELRMFGICETENLQPAMPE